MTLDTTTRKSFWRCVNGNIFCLRWIRTRWRRIPSDPMPEKPATPDLRPNGLEVSAPLYSINDKMLGAGEPLRVQPGQRVLMHLLNASAAQIHRVALSGHKFQVIALDGNPVPAPQPVDVIVIAPGERVDAIVEMNNPGVWILGEIRDVRAAIRHGASGGVRQSKAARAMDSASQVALGLHHIWHDGLWHDRAASRARPDHRHGL